MERKIALCWLRRDLRLNDQAALYHALRSGYPVLPLFIFDREILDELEPDDARVTFIHQQIEALREQLAGLGSAMIVRYGNPLVVWPQILDEFRVAAVFTNRDYEPYAVQRDRQVAALLEQQGVTFHTFKDHVIFEADEVLKDDGKPYTVFTPYSRKWRARLDSRLQTGTDGQAESFYLSSYPTEQYFAQLLQTPPMPVPSLHDMGFKVSKIAFPPPSIPSGVVRHYDKTRDLPALEQGTSRLGIHFRFGTISIREKARAARKLNDTYLNELIWRDFYSQILAHFPHVVEGPFKPQYARIPWREAPEDFKKWCEGRTGYPLVDAGMRQLNTTGYMHNRVRMVAASFLTKHLLLNWQQGETYFAQKLLDFDLASNSGGWQWAAGCGTDAAPYFRVFNPLEQAKKFDPEYKYIRRWVPEFGTPAYPAPMVEHRFARERCLATFSKALGGGET